MKRLVLAAACTMLSAGAFGGEQGIINQAGPYEATMRFYLHPAHGFPGQAETTAERGSAVEASAKEKPRARASREAGRQPASQGTENPGQSADQVATRGPA